MQRWKSDDNYPYKSLLCPAFLEIKVDIFSLQAKRCLVDSIDKFIQERIILAGVAISETYARTKINDDDVILTYAW